MSDQENRALVNVTPRVALDAAISRRDWALLLVGALLTLVVTIFAGFVVYYATLPNEFQNEEHLVYRVEDGGKFEKPDGALTIRTVVVTNAGGRAAEDLRIAVRFGTPDVLEDVSIVMSTGPAATYTSSRSVSGYDLTAPTLTPGESIRLSFLIAGTGAPIDIFAKSKRSSAMQVADDATLGSVPITAIEFNM